LPARTGLNAFAGGFDGWSQSTLRGTNRGPSFRRLAKLRIPLPTLRADFRALSLRRKRRPDHRDSTLNITKEIEHA
jgi:hypothetical protein